MFLTSLLRKLFGTSSEREIRKIEPIVREINGYYEAYHGLTDDALRAKTDEFRARIKARTGEIQNELDSVTAALKTELPPGERERYFDRKKELEKELFETEQAVLWEILPEAYACVKEACRRLKLRADKGETINVVGIPVRWDMIPFDCQLIGAVVLHQGKIAEMATGEGKTLVATMPLYLNALPGHGVHLVTVNDYLARRDSEWMGAIYKFLGLTVGCLQNEMGKEERKAQYNCDITYGTNNEFGFDYLRDNMAIRLEDQVQRGFYYAIVDEVDSVLIDEARTPLIISGPAGTSYSDIYKEYNARVANLVQKQTVLVNQKIAEAEKLLEESDKNEEKAGELLVQAKRGAPKNKRLIKLSHEPGIKKLIDRVELTYLRDKKIHLLDADLLYVIDEHEHTINLTEKGRKLLSPNNPEIFVLPDLAEEYNKIDSNPALSLTERLALKERLQRVHSERSVTVHAISQLLKAYSLFEKDVDYIVSDGKVIIVDEFTGRLMPGRRYSDGLHQALEAKENVRVEHETQTFATITLQNYFRMYKKLAGMTGTAMTEATEFYHIYRLEVVAIPTNKPVRRIDYDDLIYRTKREKYNAVIEEIERLHKEGRPVLVGTVSVETSETLSRMLKRKGIPHSVLNAKHHQKEAEIVALAGQPGAVTIATNMAGRGTDIKLGPGVVKCEQCLINYEGKKTLTAEDKAKLAECIKDVPCGLHIIGTERHEARRIDLQLRGRAGRQGDPGSSKFYLSLEDDLMRLFGSVRIASIMDRLGIKEGEVIKHPLVTRAIAQAQKRVEAQNFAIRKHLLEYDDVMNRQREVIYTKRQRILEGENLRDEYLYMIESVVDSIAKKIFNPKLPPADWNWNIGITEFRRYFSTLPIFTEDEIKSIGNEDELYDLVYREAVNAFENKEKRLGKEITDKIERLILLATIDENWKEHLYILDGLREGITLQAYGQKDPLIEYKRESFDAFMELLERINSQAIERFFRTEIVEERRPGLRAPLKVVHTSVSAYNEASKSAGAMAQKQIPSGEKQRPIRVQKIGRNDPCPCGSGKKYKHCCGARKGAG